MHANEIIVLDHGEIQERGTHKHLIAQGGIYAEMWALQTEHNSFEAKSDESIDSKRIGPVSSS
jgi:ABC-type transport system involved in cytochrome bd biosynthesis fused ATPase/permease subunit